MLCVVAVCASVAFWASRRLALPLSELGVIVTSPIVTVAAETYPDGIDTDVVTHTNTNRMAP